ncbi:MAG TPA: disulfide bond formation protein B [Candidatus Paceibacterota bacterium]|nr:disulfide bond formation protein B [Candidatus Paceibacterota bacterium]
MSPFVQSVTNLLSFLTVILDLFAAFLFFILITPLRKRGWTKSAADFFGERAIFFSFLVAFGATFGSLFYSSIANFTPCLLCWWQRIFLYPQTVLLFTAMLRKDQMMRLHAIILSSFGALIALYHMLLQFGAASIIPCSASGVSCEVVYFIEYGYVTIPTMSLTAFALIMLFMLSPNPKKRDVNEL